MRRWMMTGLLALSALVAVAIAPQLQGRWRTATTADLPPILTMAELPEVGEIPHRVEVASVVAEVPVAPPHVKPPVVHRAELSVIAEAQYPASPPPYPIDGPTIDELNQIHPIHPAGQSHAEIGCRLPIR